MNWLWYLPLLLAATLSVTFYPLFTRKGNHPLPVGLEGDPRCQLEDQREMLLRQLKEMEYDTAAALLATDDTQASRTLLEQELALVLAKLDAAPSKSAVTAAPPTGGGRGMDIASGVAIMMMVTLIAGGLYWFLGTPVMPQSAGHGAQGAAGELQAMMDGLAQRLRNEPDNVKDWLHLARSYAVMNQLPEAIAAYTHVLSRQPDNEDAMVALAALQVRSQTPEAVAAGMAVFAKILAKNPDQPDALWYSGFTAYSSGDHARALTLWQHLRDLMPIGSRERQSVEEAIREAQSTSAPKN